LDNNTIQVKIPGTSTPINITSQGTGTHTFTTTPKFVNGIIVQAGGANAGCVNVSVHKNTIFGSYLSNGIQVTGGQYFNVANNYVNFAGQSAVNANQIANGDFSNNHAYKSGTGGVKTYTFLGCSDCFIDGQRMDGDNPGDYAHQETESTGTVNTSSTGNTVTRTAGILFYPWMVGKTITVNSVDRVIATVTDITHCTLTTDPGNHTGVALTSKFANNQYSNNNGDYALVGTSQRVSAFEDGKLTTVADTAYTALFSDGIIVYTTLTAGRTVTLLSAVGRKGKELIIKDGAGSASTHNITVDGAGSETIDGSLTYVISANYGKVRIKSDGANWITL
jgi:hypothetical protein